MAACRKKLRKFYGFHRGLAHSETKTSGKQRKWNIQAVYSTEAHKPVCQGSGSSSAFPLCDGPLGTACFVTGTFGGLTPVHTVDGRTIGGGEQGPMTVRLRELYEAEIEADVNAS